MATRLTASPSRLILDLLRERGNMTRQQLFDSTPRFAFPTKQRLKKTLDYLKREYRVVVRTFHFTLRTHNFLFSIRRTISHSCLNHTQYNALFSSWIANTISVFSFQPQFYRTWSNSIEAIPSVRFREGRRQLCV